MILRLLIPAFFILQSCLNSDVSKNKVPVDSELTLRDTFHLPLDTTKIISLMNFKMKDEISSFDSYVDTLDTIVLNYISFACDCQDWVTDQYEESQNLGKHGYFIEPFSKEIGIGYEFGIRSIKARFIGKSYFDNNRKLNTPLSDTIRVFKYYAYEVLLPTMVYGPLYYTGQTELPDGKEELIQRSIITLKN